ncbi:MAG TPA: hypothetical protein VFZ26_17510 [Gemmatimonadales bacterium]
MRWLGSSWKLALVCLAAACGGSDGDGPAGPGGGGGGGVVGTYQLVGANGAALPAVVQSQACTPFQMLHGNLKLGADGRFEMRFDRIEADGQPDWTGDHGTWQQAGDELRFFSEAWGDQFEGEFWDGVLYLYYDLCSDGLGAELELAFAR